MAVQMNIFKMAILLVVSLLAACATSQHTVDQTGLASVKDQTFHIRSVELDCFGMSFIPNFPLLHGCNKDCQLGILNNIPIDNISKKLSDLYGITIAREEKLSTDASLTNLVSAIASSSAGRCFSLQNNQISASANAIDIKYYIKHHNIPPGVTVSYDIAVQSSAKTLIRHYDKIETFKYGLIGYYYDEALINIRDSAVKIADALERDIRAYPSSAKP
jgi:hypothetical protein